MSFTDGEVQALNAEVAGLVDVLPEEWYVGLPRMLSNNWCAVFRFDCGDEPEVDPVDNYLAQNYGCGSAVPGCAKFYDYEPACEFLELVRRYAESDRPIDYEAVLKAVHTIHHDTWADAIYAFTGEYATELPIEVDGMPCWLEDLNAVFYGAWLTTTVAVPHGYSTWVSPPEDKAALLVASFLDDSEGEIELAWVFESCGIENDSLEEALVRQLVCTNDTGYAYVHYRLIAGVWLSAIPENRGALRDAVNTEDFLHYYDGQAYEYGRGWYNERTEAVRQWLTRVREMERA